MQERNIVGKQAKILSGDDSSSKTRARNGPAVRLDPGKHRGVDLCSA